MISWRINWFSYTGDRWRDFKTQLTSDEETDFDHPVVKYSFIDKEIGDKSVKAHSSPEF